MKVVSETLEMVDYEDKTEEIDKTEKIDKSERKLAISIILIDLIYGMNRDTCHKMNFVIIIAQLMTFLASCISRVIFEEYSLVISITGAITSTIFMCLVLINSKISKIALDNARAHREIIEDCIDELLGGSEKSDEGSK